MELLNAPDPKSCYRFLMRTKTTIFLCSTFSDLEDERSAILDAVRKTKWVSNSMEFFGAKPGRPIETCLEEVRESDLLIVVVAHMYGTLTLEFGVSFSEAEYLEALGLGIPCFVYIKNDQTPVLPKNIERDPDKIKKLNEWKEILKSNHTVAYFSDTNDLVTSILADVQRFKESPSQPRIRRQNPNPNAPRLTAIIMIKTDKVDALLQCQKILSKLIFHTEIHQTFGEWDIVVLFYDGVLSEVPSISLALSKAGLSATFSTLITH